MKKSLVNVGGLLLFYSIIIGGIVLLNLRFSHLNTLNNSNINNTQIAMNN